MSEYVPVCVFVCICLHVFVCVRFHMYVCIYVFIHFFCVSYMCMFTFMPHAVCVFSLCMYLLVNFLCMNVV